MRAPLHGECACKAPENIGNTRPLVTATPQSRRTPPGSSSERVPDPFAALGLRALAVPKGLQEMAFATSMQHEGGQIRLMQHVPRDAAENPFEEAVATIGTRHQAIGAERP